MSLLNRVPVQIGRAERQLRDDRVFLVATDDSHAPAQYFASLRFHRVKVVPLPTPAGSGLSAPAHVVERLKTAFDHARARREVREGDEFWVLLDTDHNVRDQHLRPMVQALDTARRLDFRIAISNPCFELWLLLHHMAVKPGEFPSYRAVEAALISRLGSYNKSAIGAEQFPAGTIPDAIRRAKELEAAGGTGAGYWPMQTGTHVYRLMESIMGLS
jgi:hypothetical protein